MSCEHKRIMSRNCVLYCLDCGATVEGERPHPSQPAAVPPAAGLTGSVSLETAHSAVSWALDAPEGEGKGTEKKPRRARGKGKEA